MRLAAGIVLICRGIADLIPGPSIEPTTLHALALAGGTLFIFGLWTPIAGSLVAIIQVWGLFSQPGDPWTKILLLALGFGLAMVGPGAFSMDARLFGWKRIDFRDNPR